MRLFHSLEWGSSSSFMTKSSADVQAVKVRECLHRINAHDWAARLFISLLANISFICGAFHSWCEQAFRQKNIPLKLSSRCFLVATIKYFSVGLPSTNPQMCFKTPQGSFDAQSHVIKHAEHCIVKQAWNDVLDSLWMETERPRWGCWWRVLFSGVIMIGYPQLCLTDHINIRIFA